MKRQILIKDMNSKFKPIMNMIKVKIKKHVRINSELYRMILNQTNMGIFKTELDNYLNKRKDS